MEDMSNPKIQWTIFITLLTYSYILSSVMAQSQDGRPVADAGSSRYAGPDPIVLDGTGSYDPDDSGPLSYTWRQISGPNAIIIDANTPTPTIAGSMIPGAGRDPTPKPVGFPQTDEIQECEFELVVSDSELTSLPDTVKVIIVPDFGDNTLRLANDSFDPSKPTFVFFGGGDCITVSPYENNWNSHWLSLMNMIDFPEGVVPDSGSNPRTYYDYGDMIIVYLSSVAPDYKMPIQTLGLSTGGQPAVDVGIHLNLTYEDARFAVNRVTFSDATGYCRDYSESIRVFLTSSVEGEQCWIDNCVGTLAGSHPDVQYPSFHPNVLNVLSDKATDSSLSWMDRHMLLVYWYENSVAGINMGRSDMNRFNNGVVAGAYWSVAGPGKNLQLASTPGVETYKFIWYGDELSGYMDFYDEPNHPGRLPEPVVLVGPENGSFVDSNGTVFSCEESENAIGYQLLFGPDPYRVMDYLLISDTPGPPVGTISEFPFEQTWWTIKVYDSFGSTIHAEPRCINATIVSPPMTMPRVAYIYHDEVESAEDYQALLTSYGCSTVLIPSHEVATAGFDAYDLIIVGTDTGYMATWTDEQNVAAVEGFGKPLVGLGNGGYWYFGQLELSIGRPYGGHGSKNSIEVIDPNSTLFNSPYVIDIPQDRVLQLYTETNHIGIYLWPTLPETVTGFGREVDDAGYYPLVAEHNRYMLWGFTESPQKMTDVGKMLFINIVIHTANGAWGS